LGTIVGGKKFDRPPTRSERARFRSKSSRCDLGERMSRVATTQAPCTGAPSRPPTYRRAVSLPHGSNRGMASILQVLPHQQSCAGVQWCQRHPAPHAPRPRRPPAKTPQNKSLPSAPVSKRRPVSHATRFFLGGDEPHLRARRWMNPCRSSPRLFFKSLFITNAVSDAKSGFTEICPGQSPSIR